MITDLAEIKRLATIKDAENVEFRRYLDAHHYPDGPFRILAGEITKEIDCRACANCCRQTLVSVTPEEIAAISRFLGMTADQVVELYTVLEPDRVLKNQPDGCVFLDGNLCMIYEARPSACRDFPHLSKTKRSVGSRMSSLCRWASLCPIVYNSLEAYKALIGYTPPRKADRLFKC